MSLKSPDPITITLRNHEALVLFELLHRVDDKGLLHFDDQSEERVLWDLEAALEKQLVEPLGSTYEQDLAEARAMVRDGKG